MRSTVLLLQVVGVALLVPSTWAQAQFGPNGGYRFQERGGDSSYSEDYTPIAPTIKKTKLHATSTPSPFQIVAHDEDPAPTRRENPFPAAPLRTRPINRDEEEIQRHQAESAKYTFASSTNDRIMDGEHIRQENRDGLKTTGMYSYSDGFYKRTVEYIADENGFRVLKQTVEPIGDGPQPDPEGHADVAASYDRAKLQYSITRADIRNDYRFDDVDYTLTTPRSILPLPPPFKPAFANAHPLPPPAPSPAPAAADYELSEEELRPAERHEVQVPQRPAPLFRSHHFNRAGFNQ